MLVPDPHPLAAASGPPAGLDDDPQQDAVEQAHAEAAAPRGVSPDDDTRRLLVYLAAALLAGGQPVHEVEEDVREVGRHLGLLTVEIDARPNGVVLSLGNGTPATFESIRGGLRLDQLSEANEIAAGLRTGALAPGEALDRLVVLRARPHLYTWAGFQGGHVLVAAGITLVLQPTWPALVFNVATSPIVSSLMRFAGRSRLLATLLPLVAAFVIALLAFWGSLHGVVDVPLRTLLPTLAVLFPGGLIVTGLSELAAGAMVAGTSRLAYGTCQLLLFAIGVGAAAVALQVPGSDLSNTRLDTLGPLAPFVGVVLLTFGIALMESVRVDLLPWILGVILATYAATAVGQVLVPAPWFGALLGGTVASLGATLVETARPRLARIVVFLPSFWLLVPGSLGLVSLTQLGLEPTMAAASIEASTSIICAISIGIVVGASTGRSARAVVRTLRARAERVAA